MTIDIFDLPEGMDGGSIVTVTVAELLRTARVFYGRALLFDEMAAPFEVEVGPAPWLGDGGTEPGVK
jgi:hypothetical protein